MRYAQMVLDTASSEDQWGERVRTSAMMVLALLHYRAGDAGTARSIMEPMMEAAEALGDLSFSAEVHRLLAEILEALGELGASLDHYKRHLDFYAQVHNAERQQAFAEVEKRHALMEAIRKQEQLELRATLAEQESRQKEQELRSLATTILRRNEALKHLRSVVRTRSQNTVGREARDLAAVVLENIDAAFEDREEWTVFEKEFERVHHDFVKSLRDRCSLLTPTEIRVCILTRLGLPNKQIADSLFISGVTVKTHRRHIRRKLGLATDGNLTSLILSI
jgi:DNA-binding CsgD family transcriptional regulator